MPPPIPMAASYFDIVLNILFEIIIILFEIIIIILLVIIFTTLCQIVFWLFQGGKS